MATFNNRQYTNFRGINLRSSNGLLRFETPTLTPSTVSGERFLYVNSSNQLRFNDGSSESTLGAAGAVANFSLNDAYDDGSEITVDAASVTLTANIASAALQITQAGAGDDIQGSSNNWAVDSAGIGDFTHLFLADNAEIRFGNTQGSSDAQITWNATLLNIAGAVDFDNNVTMQGLLTVAGTASSNSFTLTAGDVSIGDGSVTMTDDDNAATLSITNTSTFTQTTSGVLTIIADSATDGNIVDINADGLTGGAILHLDTTEASFTGQYIECWDGTAGAAQFTVTANGDVTITGQGGTDVLTLVGGDEVISDGSLTMTDADNATSFSLTNNSATSSDMVTFISSGTTSGSLVRLTSTGTIVTTGSLLELVADSATTSGAGGAGRGLLTVSGDALTTGIVATFSSSAAAGTSSQLLNLDHTVAALTGAKSGQLVDIVASRTQTANNTVSDDYDALSVIRTNVNNAASGTLNAAGSMLYLQNTATQSQGTLADTVNGIEVDLQGGVEAQGIAIDIITTGTTVGRAINIVASQTDRDGIINVTANSVNTGTVQVIDANALTTGTVLELTSTGTITTTGDMLAITANSATTSTGLLRISGTGLTNGSALEIIGSGSGTFLTAGNLVDISMGTATVGTALLVIGTGTYADPGVGVVNFVSDSATTGDVLVVSGTALTSGNAILATGGGTAITSGGQVIDVVMGAATAGQGLRIVTTGAYAGTGALEVTADSSTTAGDIVEFSATSKSSGGAILNLNATAGTLTTGDYLTCNDSSVDCFAIRRNGHLASRQSTAPTAAVGTQNGITAMAITAGSTDTCGIITTTGTSTTSTTVMTLTFEEAYAIAPVVILQPANEAAAQNADDATTGAYVSSTTTTTFVISIPGSSGSTPSWYYQVIEMGS